MMKSFINNQNNKLCSITFLKGVAICMVILVHSVQWISNLNDVISDLANYGQMGCQIFFVISALTLSISWNSKNKDKRMTKDSITKFYKRRASAIVLPVWTAILFWIGVDILKVVLHHSSFREHYLISILCNVLFVNGLVPFANNWVYPGAWYLGTTVIFYLVAPFLFELMNRLKIRHMMGFTIVYTALWYIISTLIFGVEGFNNSTFWYFNILNQFPVILCGTVLYRCWNKDKFESVKHSELFFSITFVIDILLFYCPIVPNRFALVPAVAGVAFSFLIVCTEKWYNKIPAIIIRLFESYGSRSLPVLLVHGCFAWYMMAGVQRVLNMFIPDLNGTIMYLILIIPVYVLSYYFAGWLDRFVQKEREVLQKIELLRKNQHY